MQVREGNFGFTRPITGMQVVRAAQVLRATVSIVMNGQAEVRKNKPETVRRVLREELHYVPDQNALGLQRRQTGSHEFDAIGMGCVCSYTKRGRASRLDRSQ